MSAITAVLYAALAVYLGGWFFGHWIGNFSLLLFVLTTVTLGYWIAERLWFLPQRLRAAAELDAADARRREDLKRSGIEKVDGDVESAKREVLAQPWWLDWTAGLFPVILIVFLLRSFLFEPFKIPSGSMIPTLLVGDLILVNKYHYGVRLPVLNTKVTEGNPVQRGDVMVFRYPVDPRIDYIKRVVAIPGDEVSYQNQQLSVNGKPVEVKAQGEFYDEESRRYAKVWAEKLGSVEHRILVEPRLNNHYGPFPKTFPGSEACRYGDHGVTCKVPPGHYFMMGDNRDNSQDSRVWGFVPDANIVGRAFFVWMNFGNLGRIGPFN